MGQAMRVWVGIAALVAALGTVETAGAADLAPAVVEPAVPLEAPSWTGFYAGLHAGYGFGAGQDVDIARISRNNEVQWHSKAGKVSPSGVFGGGQLGYNLQYGAFVVGLETDIDVSGVEDTARGQFEPWKAPWGNSPGYYYSYRNRTKAQWFGTLRPRLGYAYGDFLFYVTGGLAYGGIKSQSDFIDGGVGSGGFHYAGHVSKSETKAGYVLGAGMEYAFAPNWTAKLEYQYLDFGDQKAHANEYWPNATPPAYNDYMLYHTKISTAFHTVRLGVNYHF